jgi:hypothetical protein
MGGFSKSAAFLLDLRYFAGVSHMTPGYGDVV